MSQLGSIGVGLSVAFALFMVVLIVELVHMWRSGQKRREAAVSNCATQAKQVHWRSTTWRHMVAASWNVLGSKEVKRWAKLCLRSRLWPRDQAGASCMADRVREGAQELMTLEEGKKQEAVEEEEEVFRVGGLWGPPRLLFTIKEETKEEMEQLEEERSAAGKGISRCTSCATSELLFVASACSSPFVTPPSSPLFATPFGSPAPPRPLSSTCRHVQRQDVDSSSSSTSSSSPPLRRPLSALFEDSSSFSSSSSTPTPATLSPSAHPPSSVSPTKRHRHPLCLLLDPPPSPSSALYHYQNRVYPLTSPTPPHGDMHVYGNTLAKPVENPLLPFSPFHLPAPCKPTTPCPFRASKSTGIVALPASSPTFQLAEDQL